MITGVYIKQNGRIYNLPKPARHADVIEMMVRNNIKPIEPSEEGFYTDDGRYLDRKEAYEYAKSQGFEPEFEGVLYSEDLW